MDPRLYLENEDEFKKFCKSVFDEFDMNKDGIIDYNEFKLALIKFAKNVGVHDIEEGVIIETMKALDIDNSKTLTLQEIQMFFKKFIISMYL